MAETFATVALCPWEALRIRMVAQPDFAPNTIAGLSRIFQQEGLFG
jgi:solute carrier family 25 phosphate transporter 3